MSLLQNTVTEHIPLHPLLNKTGDVWHVFLRGDFTDMLYAYKLDGHFLPQQGHFYDSSRLLLDPYAKVSAPPLYLYTYLCYPIITTSQITLSLSLSSLGSYKQSRIRCFRPPR